MVQDSNQNVEQVAVQPRPGVLTAHETFRRFKVSDNTGYSLVLRGEFPVRPIRVGRQIRFSEAEVNRVLAGEPVREQQART